MRTVFVKSGNLLVNDNNPHVCLLFIDDSWNLGTVSIDDSEDCAYFTDVETSETIRVMDA